MTSGYPLTLVFPPPRPIRKPEPLPEVPRVVGPPNTGLANIAPPTLSKLPVRVLTTSTSQLAVVPNSVVVVPIRPYTAALEAALISRAT